MATNRWIGGAPAVAQVNTVTITGTWAAATTVTVTANGAALVMTATGTMTVSEVASAVAAMINGSSITDLAETRSMTGDLVSQWAGITATSDSGVVTITSGTAGVPFDFSASDSNGSGAATAATVTAATGPWHLNNAVNWSLGVVPASGDTIIIEDSPYPILYALETYSADTWASVTLRNAPAIGLEELTLTTLPKRLKVGMTALVIEESAGNLCRLNGHTVQSAIYLRDADEVDWIGVHTSTTIIVSGRSTLRIAADAGVAATFATLLCANGAAAYVGDGVTIQTSLTVDGATLFVHDSAIPAVTAQNNSSVTVTGTAAITALTATTGGLVVVDTTGTVTAATIGGGTTLNLANDGRTKTVTALTMVGRATVVKNTRVTITGITYTDVQSISTAA